MFEKINKYAPLAVYFLIIVSVLNGCNSCNGNKSVVKLQKKVDSLNVEVQGFKLKTYNKQELDIRIAIEGYEISKRMLYDNNAILRTATRPDDVLNSYDKKIEELREKLIED